MSYKSSALKRPTIHHLQSQLKPRSCSDSKFRAAALTPQPNFKSHTANGQDSRQGLTRLPRKVSEAWPARCGGDVRSPRKPAGPAFRQPRSSPESPAAAPNAAKQKPAKFGIYSKKVTINLESIPKRLYFYVKFACDSTDY